jgi:hypothetical protein
VLAINIVAYVAESEKPIVRRAADEIARAVGAASSETPDCDCRFIESLDELANLDGRTIVVASLLREADSAEAWSTTEQRLSATYAALAARDVPALICTVFRHIGRTGDPAADAERLLRVRRLNLLAMEISRLTGAYVIDLDRALSDIGAVRLQTNYLLEGRVAGEQAAYVIAGSLINDALDGVVSVEVQNGAMTALNSARPAFDEVARTGELTLLPSAVPIGSGRRSRSAKPILVTVQTSRVDTVLRNVLRGSIGPREIGARLMRAVRQRGLRTTTYLLAAGLVKQLRVWR